MRVLCWFSGGFALACLTACLLENCRWPALAAALLLLLAFVLRRRTRPGEREHPDPALLPTPRRRLYAASRRAVVFLLGFLLALGWIRVYTGLIRVPAEAAAGEDVVISGQVLTFPEDTSIGGYSLTLRLDEGHDVLLYAPAEWGTVRPGDRVWVRGELKPSNFLYGEESMYHTARGVYLLGYCDEPPLVERWEKLSPLRWPAYCAHALKEGIAAAFGEAAPLTAAVVLGDKTGLSEELRSSLTRSGIMHAVVVSGLHISYVVTFFLLMCRRRRRASIIVLPFLLFFALMAGGTPSALRAVIMQAVLLLSLSLGRRGDPPSSLGLALVLLLAQNPYAAGSISLQLSFAAVTGILLCTRRIYTAIARPVFRRISGTKWDRRLSPPVKWLASALGATLGAQLFTIPITALYFGQLSLVAVFTNVLTLWAVSLLLVGGLVVGALAIAFPALMAVPGFIVGLLARYITAVAGALGGLSLASLDAADPYVALWLAAVYFLLWPLVRARKKLPALAAAVVTALLLLMGAVGFNAWDIARADLSVTALDVEQGAATLFFSGGQTALVDCGGKADRSAGDIAADHLLTHGRTGVDILIFTHLDDDHFNGVERLFRRVRVGEVWLPESGSDPERVARLAALAEEEGAALFFVTDTVTIPFGDGSFTLFPPLGGGESNEEGLFVLCSRGETDLFLTGDAEEFVESLAVKYYPIPDIEVLFAGHHGSNGSTGQALLDALCPEAAVISVGYNPYGHPGEELLARLEERGIRIYRTDTMGHIKLSFRDGQMRIH